MYSSKILSLNRQSIIYFFTNSKKCIIVVTFYVIVDCNDAVIRSLSVISNAASKPRHFVSLEGKGVIVER